MAEVRLHITVPAKVLEELDRLVGPRSRSDFVTEQVEREVRRRRLIDLLSRPGARLEPDNHPEWKHGATAWVRKLRRSGTRQRRLAELWDNAAKSKS